MSPVQQIRSTDILDSTIIAGDVADRAISNIKLAADVVGRQNFLANGGFELWRAGVGPFGANTYNADRWYGQIAGGIATFNGTITRSTSSDIRSQYCWTANVIASVTDWCRIYQIVEVGPSLANTPISLSVRAKVSVANAVRVFAYADANAGGGGGTAVSAYSSYHSGGGAYETLTVTIQTPAGCNYVMVAIFFNATCTPFVDNAMLVLGNVPTDFVPMHPADDRARCGDTAWTTLTLTAPWVPWDTGGTWSVGEYRKDSAGWVHIRGLLNSGASAVGTVVATLPVGYRPGRNEYFACSVAASTVAGWYIRPDGALLVGGVQGGYLQNSYYSISGISYLAEG